MSRKPDPNTAVTFPTLHRLDRVRLVGQLVRKHGLVSRSQNTGAIHAYGSREAVVAAIAEYEKEIRK